jgi:hypothetical protein
MNVNATKSSDQSEMHIYFTYFLNFILEPPCIVTCNTYNYQKLHSLLSIIVKDHHTSNRHFATATNLERRLKLKHETCLQANDYLNRRIPELQFDDDHFCQGPCLATVRTKSEAVDPKCAAEDRNLHWDGNTQ